MNVKKELKRRNGNARILYNDNEGVTLNGTLHSREIFYIDSFDNTSGIKGRGKRLLCYVINNIMQDHIDITHIQLNSAPESQEPIGSVVLATQQKNLNKYYETLGFKSINEDIHEYLGEINVLYQNC